MVQNWTDEAHYLALIRDGGEIIYTYDGLVKNGMLCVDGNMMDLRQNIKTKGPPYLNCNSLDV